MSVTDEHWYEIGLIVSSSQKPRFSQRTREMGHPAYLRDTSRWETWATRLYRLTSKRYPDTTNVEYTYDLVGKVKSVPDPTGVYGFAYDNMGRLISTTTNYTFVSGTYTNAYTYDAASNRQSLTAPDTSITTYGYDTLNRLNG